MAGKRATSFMLLDLRSFDTMSNYNECEMMTSQVVITSINIDGNLLLIGSSKQQKDQAAEQFKMIIPKIPAYFTGTGDLMTALLLGWSNKYPDNLAKAAELAVSRLQAVLQQTINDYRRAGFDPETSSLEIRLIQSQEDIRNPHVKFNAKKFDWEVLFLVQQF